MSGELAVIETNNPLEMLSRLAANENVDVAVVEKYMELAERWKADRAREAFAHAMVAAQSEIKTVVRDAKNTHTQSRYARLETVSQAIRPVYQRHGFSVSVAEGEPPRENWLRVIMTVRHVEGHTETYMRTGPIDDKGPKGNAVKSQLHGCASTVSYLQRHLLCDVFDVVVADEDSDGSGDATPITEEQTVALRQWIETTESDEARFLKHYSQVCGFELTSLAELPAEWFDLAMGQLKAKAKNQGKS